ncbi:MAG: LPS export ABC transporter permease LptF [Bdellovibrionales bacterium]|nr:LPS export ABC transporter permease LptF [Bdellovibrionales bacterium]
MFREILVPFFISLFVFTGILFLARILRLIDLAINKNVPIGDILWLFSMIIPRFLEMAVPMSLLIGTLVAFGRLSSDSELVVMRATGLSMRKLAIPVACFSFVAFGATLIIALTLRPWANYQLGVGMFELAKQKTSSALIQGVFNDFGPLTIYSEHVEPKGGRLRNVIIADEREEEPSTFVASNGQIVSDDKQRTLTLRLYKGSIHQGGGLNYNVTDFDINNIRLDFDVLEEGETTKTGKKTSEMYLGELNEVISNLRSKGSAIDDEDSTSLARAIVEWHRRLAVPSSCLFIAFVAMALGIQPSRGGDSWGAALNVAVGILVIVGYYLLLALLTAASRKSVENAWVLMWVPNLVVAAASLAAFKLMESERWLSITQAMGHLFATIRQKIQSLTEKQRA